MPPTSEVGGFFDGPWLRRAAILALTAITVGACGWLLWVKVVIPNLQVAAISARKIKVPSQESPELESLLGEAIVELDKHKYHEARQLFLQVQKQAQTERMRTIAEGLVTATYDGAGEHNEGLDYLCRIYAGRPSQDVRYRFAFQAHLRAIAEQHGKEAAEELVTRLRPKCPRRDLSYVWVGIPRGKAEFLEKGMTLYDEFHQLPSEDRDYLQHVIRDYPQDPFVDHALYFLHKFDRVIQEHPQSLILDVVYRAAAKQAMKAKKYDLAIVYLKGYLETGAKRWPKLPHGRQVKVLLAKAYSGKGDLKTAIGWLLQLESGAGTELASLLGQEGPFADAEEVRAFLDTLTGFHSPEELGDIFDSRCKDQFDLGTEALRDLDYAQALIEYQKVREVFVQHGLENHVPWCVNRGIEVLNRFNEYDEGPPEDLLQLGVDLRTAARELGNPAFEIAAATVWEDCAERFSNTEEAPKALYLAGAAWRRLGYYLEAKDTFQRLTKKYPESELADDANTEIGWYYLFLEKNYRLARTYFFKVAEASSGNARDNALFWLGRTYAEEGDFPKALDVYKQLVDRFPFGRLARDPHAPQEIKRLERVIASKAERHILINIVSLESSSAPTGLRVLQVKKEEEKKENGLRRNDVIIAVEGKGVDTTELLYNLLEPFTPGAEVTLTVMRGQVELTIPGKIGKEFYYRERLEFRRTLP